MFHDSPQLMKASFESKYVILSSTAKTWGSVCWENAAYFYADSMCHTCVSGRLHLLPVTDLSEHEMTLFPLFSCVALQELIGCSIVVFFFFLFIIQQISTKAVVGNLPYVGQRKVKKCLAKKQYINIFTTIEQLVTNAHTQVTHSMLSPLSITLLCDRKLS